jgi:hypothetical protein
MAIVQARPKPYWPRETARKQAIAAAPEAAVEAASTATIAALSTLTQTSGGLEDGTGSEVMGSELLTDSRYTSNPGSSNLIVKNY